MKREQQRITSLLNSASVIVRVLISCAILPVIFGFGKLGDRLPQFICKWRNDPLCYTTTAQIGIKKRPIYEELAAFSDRQRVLYHIMALP